MVESLSAGRLSSLSGGGEAVATFATMARADMSR